MAQMLPQRGRAGGQQAAPSLNTAILETFRPGLGCRPHPPAHSVGSSLATWKGSRAGAPVHRPERCLQGPEQAEGRLMEGRGGRDRCAPGTGGGQGWRPAARSPGLPS